MSSSPGLYFVNFTTVPRGDRDDVSARGDMLVETQAEEPAFSCQISLNGDCGDWYWEVTCGGYIVARGLGATQAQARTDAMRAALSHVDPENLPYLEPLPPLPHFGAV